MQQVDVLYLLREHIHVQIQRAAAGSVASKGVVWLVSLWLVFVLSACDSTAQYELNGTWDYTIRVTQSAFEEPEVGEVTTGEFIIAATET